MLKHESIAHHRTECSAITDVLINSEVGEKKRLQQTARVQRQPELGRCNYHLGKLRVQRKLCHSCTHLWNGEKGTKAAQQGIEIPRGRSENYAAMSLQQIILT